MAAKNVELDEERLTTAVPWGGCFFVRNIVKVAQLWYCVLQVASGWVQSLANQELTTPNVWQALDRWAVQLKAWQRRILFFATRGGTLTSDQIDAVHQLFLAESNLCEPQAGCEASLEVSGRPAEALTRSLHLRRIDALCGVNALPDGSALTFAPGLTVIYGRSGAGKTGFARVIANACFSRHRPEIWELSP